MAKSRVYTQDDDSKVSFEFGSNSKLIGIKKDGASLDPQSQEFEDLQDVDMDVIISVESTNSESFSTSAVNSAELPRSLERAPESTNSQKGILPASR